jgi:hypothetical protein
MYTQTITAICFALFNCTYDGSDKSRCFVESQTLLIHLPGFWVFLGSRTA